MKILSLLAGLLMIIALVACDSTAATPTPAGVTPPGNTPVEGEATPTTPASAPDPTDTPADSQSNVETEPTATSGATGLGDGTRTTEAAFVFMPRQGGPGALVNITGGSFTPGTMVILRIGTPDPVGEPLASVRVNDEGMWNTSITMPGTLPSGQALPAGEIQIVVMDENNNVISKKPFRFIPSP